MFCVQKMFVFISVEYQIKIRLVRLLFPISKCQAQWILMKRKTNVLQFKSLKINYHGIKQFHI